MLMTLEFLRYRSKKKNDLLRNYLRYISEIFLFLPINLYFLKGMYIYIYIYLLFIYFQVTFSRHGICTQCFQKHVLPQQSHDFSFFYISFMRRASCIHCLGKSSFIQFFSSFFFFNSKKSFRSANTPTTIVANTDNTFVSEIHEFSICQLNPICMCRYGFVITVVEVRSLEDNI